MRRSTPGPADSSRRRSGAIRRWAAMGCTGWLLAAVAVGCGPRDGEPPAPTLDEARTLLSVVEQSSDLLREMRDRDGVVDQDACPERVGDGAGRCHRFTYTPGREGKVGMYWRLPPFEPAAAVLESPEQLKALRDSLELSFHAWAAQEGTEIAFFAGGMSNSSAGDQADDSVSAALKRFDASVAMVMPTSPSPEPQRLSLSRLGLSSFTAGFGWVLRAPESSGEVVFFVDDIQWTAEVPEPLRGQLGTWELPFAVDEAQQEVGYVGDGLNSYLFDKPGEEPLTPDERNHLMLMWSRFIDYDVVFSAYGKRFLGNWRLGEDDDARLLALTLGYGAHIAQVHASLSLISLVGATQSLYLALDEASPAHGLAAGHYERVLRRSAAPKTLLLLEIAGQALRRRSKNMIEEDDPEDALIIELIETTTAYSKTVTENYREVGPMLIESTVDRMVGNELNNAIMPLQTDIALWMGDTRIAPAGRSLITEEQLDQVAGDLQPGDVLIERRNWYLSNLGLPGFWPHAALYVGDEEKLRSLDADPEVARAYPRGFTTQLAEGALTKSAWQAYAGPDGEGHAREIIEAVSEGVVFTSLYHSCLADYVAFMRPNPRLFSALERARAIERAFQHWGKPYDFDFDFLTDDALVCSELVWTSYQAPSDEGRSINFPLSSVLGRLTLPPTDIVRQFDEEAEDEDTRQLIFVAFLDGNEHAHSAVFADEEDLRDSWNRPKWDISQE